MADATAALTPVPVLLGDLFAWQWAVPTGIVILLAVLIGLVCWFRPYWPLRGFLWFLAHSIYWVRVIGRSHVPPKGAALLVCNHVSYVDWLLLMASQRRFIRFVVWAGFTKRWGLRHLLRWAGCIPIDGASGPRAIVKSLRAASDSLARGELVCIFAEGRFTQTGVMLPFRRGFEQVLKHCKAPIIPVCLDQVWGSIFSYFGGRIFTKLPLEIPYHATVAYGQPLPNDAKAAEVRQAIQELSADCAIARDRRRVPVHRRFVRMASRRPFRPCLSDSRMKGKFRRYGETLAGAICLARSLRPMLDDAAMVGVWMPPSVGGAVANIALALLGKTSVNLNYTAGAQAVNSALRQCGCKHVLTAKHFIDRAPMTPSGGVEPIHIEAVFKAIPKSRLRWTWLQILLTPTWILEHWVLGLGRHTTADLATIIFSSGSTGEPKGVMLTHGNIAANVESMIQAATFGPNDRVLGVLPLFHSFGYTVTLWAPLQIGASSVYHADPRQAKDIGELCKSQRCTIYVSTATFLRFMLRKCEADDFRTLRILICGAEKLPQSAAQDFETKFGVLPLRATAAPNWPRWPRRICRTRSSAASARS